jgi:hypothetical protein
MDHTKEIQVMRAVICEQRVTIRRLSVQVQHCEARQFLNSIFLALGFVLAFLVGMSALAGCGAVAPADTVDESEYCPVACAKLEQFRCPDTSRGIAPGPDELYGTPDDVPCEQVCIDLEKAGADLFTKCISEANNCNEITACAKGGN